MLKGALSTAHIEEILVAGLGGAAAVSYQTANPFGFSDDLIDGSLVAAALVGLTMGGDQVKSFAVGAGVVGVSGFIKRRLLA